MDKKYFALKLNPPRATFFNDITEEEMAVMKRHSAYWHELMKHGKVVVFGPILDPNAAYGFGVVAVESEDEVKILMANDPANGLGSYEYYPMLAVVPTPVSQDATNFESD